MASRGRGGRGRGKELGVPSPGKNPGQGQGEAAAQGRRHKIPGNIEGLTTYLNSLNESNIKTYGSMFADMVIGYSSNKKKLEEAVRIIFNTTVQDRDSATLGAVICEKIAMAPSPGEPETTTTIRAEFRKALLAVFQAEFARRKEIRSHSIEAWLSVFTFLCELYVRIKVGDQPILVVGKAILSTMDYLLSLDDSLDDELDCVCTNLKLCGRFLEMQGSQQVEKLITSLRARAITKKTSCRVRCLIMEVLEFRSMGWNDPERKLEDFYVDALADAVAEDELSEDN